MSSAVGLALLDSLFPLVGAAFLLLVGVAGSLGAGVRLLGLSYLTGWALLGVVLSLLVLVGLPLTVASVLVVAGVLVTACLLGSRHSPFTPLDRRAPVAPSRFDRWIVGAGVVVLCVGGAAAVATAVRGEWNPAHDFDALFFYLPRAYSLYLSHGLHASSWRLYPHPEYPPLFPVITGATFAFAGFHPSLLPFQQVLLALAFLLAVVAFLDRVAPRWLSVPALALLGTSPWFWSGHQSLLPDQAVAYMIAAAALACVLWLLEPHPAWLALAVLFLAAGALTKLEGTFSALVLAVVVVITSLVHFGRRGARALVLLAGPGAIVFWRIWLHANHLPGSSNVYAISDAFNPSYLDDHLDRLRYSLSAMASTAGQMLGGITPAARTGASGHIEIALLGIGLVVLLVFAARSSRAVAAASACWLVIAFAGLETIYWIGRVPVKIYVDESVDRVMATPALVTLTLLPLLLALALRVAPSSRDTLTDSTRAAPP